MRLQKTYRVVEVTQHFDGEKVLHCHPAVEKQTNKVDLVLTKCLRHGVIKLACACARETKTKIVKYVFGCSVRCGLVACVIF